MMPVAAPDVAASAACLGVRNPVRLSWRTCSADDPADTAASPAAPAVMAPRPRLTRPRRGAAVAWTVPTRRRRSRSCWGCAPWRPAWEEAVGLLHLGVGGLLLGALGIGQDLLGVP